jgi:hypothetical protein
MAGERESTFDQVSLGLDDPGERGATAQPPALSDAPDILERAADELAESGVAGERRVMMLLYLAVVSRLLERPCSIAVKGPSAGGKSFLVEQVLRLFPPGAYYALSAMSERALAYDTEPLVHRMLVVYESAGVDGRLASYLMRSLLSEGRINYVTVDKAEGRLGGRRILREGPTGLITTTTAVALHPENETRMLSVTIADSPDQTRAVMVAHARGRRLVRDQTEWHSLQAWLAETGTDVAIPYALTLAEAIPPIAVRLRRDFGTLIGLIEAHALLHQRGRERDEAGRIVASFADYKAVRALVSDLVADAADRSIAAGVRETVRALIDLAASSDPLDEGISISRVAEACGVDKSTALRRVRVAINRGFIRNFEERRGRQAKLVTGDPMPDDADVLPPAAELERLHGCGIGGRDELAVGMTYPGVRWATEGDREIDSAHVEIADARGAV